VIFGAFSAPSRANNHYELLDHMKPRAILFPGSFID
jgi:hypothetical protein